jgi:hypothetical protein
MCWLDRELRNIEKKQIQDSGNDEYVIEGWKKSIGVGVRVR